MKGRFGVVITVKFAMHGFSRECDQLVQLNGDRALRPQASGRLELQCAHRAIAHVRKPINGLMPSALIPRSSIQRSMSALPNSSGSGSASIAGRRLYVSTGKSVKRKRLIDRGRHVDRSRLDTASLKLRRIAERIKTVRRIQCHDTDPFIPQIHLDASDMGVSGGASARRVLRAATRSALPATGRALAGLGRPRQGERVDRRHRGDR